MSSVADDWSAVAEAWDDSAEYVERHSTDATAALVERLDVRPGDRLLELAAGPGTLGATWSALVGSTGRVVLSDIAPGMVDVARRRNATCVNVEHALVDASDIAWPDGSFDVVACRMGLMFTPDPRVALREIRRVLAPGGRFGSLTWGGVDRNPWMTCVGMAAMMNGLIAGGPPIGPGGIFSLSDPSHVADLVDAAGFRGVAVDVIPTTFRSESIETHVARVGALAGPLASVLAAATPEQLDALHATAAQLAADHVTDEGVALPGEALLVTAHG